MKRIEFVWNVVHYFVWKLDYKAHLFFNKINPFMLLHKLPFQKKMYERRGININEDINRSFKDPKYGLSSVRAGGFMFILSLVISFTLFCFIQSIKNSGYLSSVFFIVIAVVLGVLNYFILLYKDKYLEYFKEFEIKPKVWKKKWGMVSLTIVFLIMLLLILSINIMTFSLHHFGFLRNQ
ncbi:MAG: hypothetical protein JST58_10665 [Bacteroidetes bacterium]|nr:hypothetical protein [Bacteroidota bacterium]